MIPKTEPKDDFAQKFFAHITPFAEKENPDRAALSVLRRGLMSPPGQSYEMYRYLPVWVMDNDRLEEYCLLASLFALHPKSQKQGDLGAHFATARDKQQPDKDSAVERRFTQLLSCHVDDLPLLLRQAISFLSSRDTPVAIHWEQLLRDVLYWDHPEQFVQKRWARHFWSANSQHHSRDDAAS